MECILQNEYGRNYCSPKNKHDRSCVLIVPPQDFSIFLLSKEISEVRGYFFINRISHQESLKYFKEKFLAKES